MSDINMKGCLLKDVIDAYARRQPFSFATDEMFPDAAHDSADTSLLAGDH